MNPSVTFNFPRQLAEFKSSTDFEDLTAGILHSSKTFFCAKQQFSHVLWNSSTSEGTTSPNYNDTENSAPCIKPLQLFHTCVCLQTTHWLYRVKITMMPAMEAQYKWAQESRTLFCYYQQRNHQLRFGSKFLWLWRIPKKEEPTFTFRSQAGYCRASQGGGGKQKILMKQTYFLKSLRKKINTKTHKWYCSSLRSEILFAKFQPGDIR